MSITYHPLGPDDLIIVKASKIQNEDLNWELTVEVTKNDYGDLNRFIVYGPQCAPLSTDRLWGVADPSEDVLVPAAPAENEDNLRRVHKIKIIHSDIETIDSSLTLILDDLDEYLRTVALQNDLELVSTYTFQ